MSLTEHLRNGQQCDEDGVMCIVSRQACHEAADELEILWAALRKIDDIDRNALSLGAAGKGLSEVGEVARRALGISL